MECKNWKYRLPDWLFEWWYKETKDWARYREWKRNNIVEGGFTIEEFFKGFDFILELDYDKVYYNDKYYPFFGPSNDKGITKYLYPQRELGDNCYLIVLRVDGNIINEFGEDKVYIGTNSEEDAAMLSLTYS
jgi:hypothetical protein